MLISQYLKKYKYKSTVKPTLIFKRVPELIVKYEYICNIPKLALKYRSLCLSQN